MSEFTWKMIHTLCTVGACNPLFSQPNRPAHLRCAAHRSSSTRIIADFAGFCEVRGTPRLILSTSRLPPAAIRSIKPVLSAVPTSLPRPEAWS